MRIPEEEMMPYNDHVVGFSGERVGTKGYIDDVNAIARIHDSLTFLGTT